jgi:ABC-type dipeptide/oligopeptide/nickel transport system permease subunit
MRSTRGPAHHKRWQAPRVGLARTGGRGRSSRAPRDPIGGVLVLAVALVALGADLLAPYDLGAPISARPAAARRGVLFGTDHFRHDILSRVISAGGFAEIGFMVVVMTGIFGR